MAERIKDASLLTLNQPWATKAKQFAVVDPGSGAHLGTVPDCGAAVRSHVERPG